MLILVFRCAGKRQVLQKHDYFLKTQPPENIFQQ